jgi:hypothetical protein
MEQAGLANEAGPRMQQQQRPAYYYYNNYQVQPSHQRLHRELSERVFHRFRLVTGCGYVLTILLSVGIIAIFAIGTTDPGVLDITGIPMFFLGFYGGCLFMTWRYPTVSMAPKEVKFRIITTTVSALMCGLFSLTQIHRIVQCRSDPNLETNNPILYHFCTHNYTVMVGIIVYGSLAAFFLLVATVFEVLLYLSIDEASRILLEHEQYQKTLAPPMLIPMPMANNKNDRSYY